MDKNFFRVIQKAVLKREGKYLILKREPNTKVYPNTWDFPGGRLELLESLSDGLEREVREETGLGIKISNPIFTFSEVINEIPLVFIVYSCQIEGEERINLSEEHTEYRWASKEEILKLDIEKFLRAYLEKE